MPTLKDTIIYRGGSTATTLSRETSTVTLESRFKAGPGSLTNVGAVRLSFSISAGGGGTTALLVDIGERDFQALVEAMAALSPKDALPAMAAALAQHMAKLPEHEALIKKRAQTAVLDRTLLALQLAPEDNNEVEKLVFKRVTKFVEELTPKPAPEKK